MKTSSSLRLSDNSPLPLPACGPMAASSTAPVDTHATPASLICAKPTPSAWLAGCGQRDWFSAVSGITIPAPSPSFTGRPRQRQPVRTWRYSRSPASRLSVVTICTGTRRRARQYPPVRALGGVSPAATHWAIQPLTALWHERSCERTCFRNIASATVGGYSRSRCCGSSASVFSSSSGPVRALKKSTASSRCDRPAMRD